MRLRILETYIYISVLPPWFGDLHTHVTKQKNNNEKKVKMKKKEQQTKIHEQTIT